MASEKWQTACGEEVIANLGTMFRLDASFDCNDLKVLVIYTEDYPMGLKIESGWQTIIFKKRIPLRTETLWRVSCEVLDKYISRTFSTENEAIDFKDELENSFVNPPEVTIEEYTEEVW